jgi:hypothetical protein
LSISRIHPGNQDVIDDFRISVATRGLSLSAQFISHVVQRALIEADQPTEQRGTGVGARRAAEDGKCVATRSGDGDGGFGVRVFLNVRGSHPALVLRIPF